MKKLQITVSPSGEVSIAVEGAPGASCLGATKFLEDALGVVASREYTAEFYQEAEAGESVKVGGE